MPSSSGSVAIKLSEPNFEADTEFVNGSCAGLASFAGHFYSESGRGVVKCRVEDVLTWNEQSLEVISSGAKVPPLFLDYLSASKYFPKSQINFDLTAGQTDDHLRYAVERLIYAYDPESEFLILLTQDGGPYRLYQIRSDNFSPTDASRVPPFQLN